MGRHVIYGLAVALFVVLAVVAAVTVEPLFALPVGLVGLIMLGFFGVNDLAARRILRRHGDDPLAAQSAEQESVPTAHVIPDESALGDTAEAHAEVNPHDLPPDAPGRRAAEEQAADRERGTTRGDRHGAADGAEIDELDEPPPPSREEGYPEGEPSSRRAH